jgi:threonine dehydrogenase-like Zn-dependent dehydrogenase
MERYTMPKEILSDAPGSLVYAQYEEQDIPAGSLRAKVEYAAPKHGTEMHIFLGNSFGVPNYYDYETKCFLPMTQEMLANRESHAFKPGKMWVGRVTQLGEGIDGFAIGDRVAGYGSLRESQTVPVGQEKDPGNGGIWDILRVPEDMDWKACLMYDPCQFALAGVRDSNLRLGDIVCVTGLGAIGLMAAQMARLQGAKTVIVSDPIEKRRRIALENGADYDIDPTHEDAGLRMKQLTGGKGVDVVIETSATYPGLQGALRGLAYGGRISVVGWFNDCKTAFSLGQEAHMNNATIFFSRACSEPNPDWPRWSWTRINEECWHLLSSGMLRCDNIIDPIVPFEEAAEAYLDVVAMNPAKSVKMGVTF